MSNKKKQVYKLSVGKNLTQLAEKGKLVDPLFRDALIEKVFISLDQKRSVLLLGEEGVGKSAILQGLAIRLLNRELNKASYSLAQLSTGEIMSGTRFLGEWESKLNQVISDAIAGRIILCFNDIWNIPYAGKSTNSPSSFLEMLKPRMNDQGVILIGEITTELLHSLQQTQGFLSSFDIIKVDALDASHIDTIVQNHSQELGLRVSSDVLERVVELCNQFLLSSPGPRQPLKLLDRVKQYVQDESVTTEQEDIDSDFIENVFSTYTGLPVFVLNRDQPLKVNEVREWFRERIIGQEEAIEAVVESIVMFKAAINDPEKPLGTFMFVGPTGVGKTELAKALAIYLFGNERRLLRFDLSEFSDYHSYKTLIGDPGDSSIMPRLSTPVQQQPFQVVLFDELEKGHMNIRDLLLQILDEGRLSDASGKHINFRSTFVIVTSNVGAFEAGRKRIGFGSDSVETDNIEKLREGLEQFFRPEFLNRFQRIVPFHALRREQVERIVRKEIALVLGRRGISARNLAIDLSDELIEHVSNQGYDPRYGARALKREIERQVVMPVAKVLSEQNPAPGSVLKLDARTLAGSDSLVKPVPSVRILNTEQSIAHIRQSQPLKSANGKSVDRQSLRAELAAFTQRWRAMKILLEKSGLFEKLEELESKREAPDLWSNADTANELLYELDELRVAEQRHRQLYSSLIDVEALLTPDCSRQTLVHIDERLQVLEQKMTTVHRELVLLGTDKKHDVLLIINPLSSIPEQRNALFEMYKNWALWCGFTIDTLHEPLEDKEPIVCSVAGAYAFGYLQRESGIHRFRQNERSKGAIRVNVVPWIIDPCKPVFESRTALRKTGQLGGQVRSRSVVIEPARLVLQNAGTLEENRELAVKCTTALQHRPEDSDESVRRYDDDPFMVKDLLTQQRFNRRDCLKPAEFHELLCRRIDI